MISSENSLHAAIGVVDDEPLLGAKQLVRDDKRADRVVRRAAARVADDMRVALSEAGVFRRIKPCVHPGEYAEAPRRGQREIALLSEALRVGFDWPRELR